MKREGCTPLNSLVEFAAELPCKQFQGAHHPFPVLDLLPLDEEQLQRIAELIEQAQREGTTMVACALGVSRSAGAVAAWLICYRAYSADEAIGLVCRQRRCVIISPEQKLALLKLVPI